MKSASERGTTQPLTARRTKSTWWSTQIQWGNIRCDFASCVIQFWVIGESGRKGKIWTQLSMWDVTWPLSLSWPSTGQRTGGGVRPHRNTQRAEARALANKWRNSREEKYNEFYFLCLQWLNLPLSPSCPFTSAESPEKNPAIFSLTFFYNFEVAGLSEKQRWREEKMEWGVRRRRSNTEEQMRDYTVEWLISSLSNYQHQNYKMLQQNNF